MDRTFLLIGGIAGFVGVGCGAFAAHGLKARLTPEMLAVFETGARYQMYHALAIVLVAVLIGQSGPARWLPSAGWCFTGGIVVFSGSLYALALTGVGILGAITPIGGLLFLAGWASLAGAAVSR